MAGIQPILFTSRYAGVVLVLGMLALVFFVRISLWLIVQEISRICNRERFKRRRLNIFAKRSHLISFPSSRRVSRQMYWPLAPRVFHSQRLITLGRTRVGRPPKSAGGSR